MYYKVVRPFYRQKGNYYSIIATGHLTTFLHHLAERTIGRIFPKLNLYWVGKYKMLTLYKVGQWTFTKPAFHLLGYDLLVFKTLEDANRAIIENSWDPYAIFTVDVFGVKTNLPPIRLCSDFDYILNGTKWPEGSLMAYGVKLVKNVTDGE